METVQEKIRYLVASGMTASDIEDALDGRAGVRSVYRWAKGERAPTSKGTLEAIDKLVASVKRSKGDT